MTAKTRIALVTGANRGIGRAVSDRLHALGHRVVVTARDPEEAERAAAALGRDARAAVLDVTDEQAPARVRDLVGPVDIMVNNAGIQLDWGHPPSVVPVELVRRQFEVNVLGAWRMCQAFLPGMVERGWGRVVMVSSGTGAFSNGLSARTPGYSVSKTALNALTVLMAAETAGTGVLVNAVNPGQVRTRMRPQADRLPEQAAEDIVWAATLPDDGPSGVFLRGRKETPW
ncbi:SDR family NAD(P)-dependent oxidoreductase [Nonomuraea cavernae]|uniref:Short-chain dehydrogenase n=1 Tax=Nonomuraea cavernae TaxID=2045107 RepID=A0A917ZID5_9ACTN|nr:SDR family NAD(P)-dependent oxidoreductase [Nonomuraea cavernae]MCA2189497.1 SDR family NAD(P)-dependent oxidoreductase [Nonomuraea cavernae]GGO83526.1 short-chain dehydrogenase [Nonomuraea cavernae]